MKKASFVVALSFTALVFFNLSATSAPKMSDQEIKKMAETEDAFISAFATVTIDQCSGKDRSKFCQGNMDQSK